MRILTDNTGKGQLEVLSVLAERPEQRQSEIVETSSLSKGAVSNNVNKLRDKDLIEGEDKIQVNEERLLNLYKGLQDKYSDYFSEDEAENISRDIAHRISSMNFNSVERKLRKDIRKEVLLEMTDRDKSQIIKQEDEFLTEIVNLIFKNR